MRNKLISFLSIIMLTCCLFGLSACFNSDPHIHEYKTLKYNEYNHWYECSCGDKGVIKQHTPGALPTETTDQTCTGCGYVIAPKLGHNHTLHLTKVDAKVQSCTENGNIEYYVCSCGKWFTSQTATTEITDKNSVIIEKGAHSYTQLEKSAIEHWYECSCGDKQGVTAHFGGTATCTEKAKCEICDEKYGDLKSHEYKILKKNATEHWYECSCGESQGNTEHFGGTATCTVRANCEVCGETYGSVKAHEYKILKKNATEHWYECSCGESQGNTAHYGGTATCTEKARCDECDEGYGTLKSHVYDNLRRNVTHHWYECYCGDAKPADEHIPGESATETTSQLCTVCEYVITPMLGHVHTLHLEKVDAVKQSCTKEGNIEYYVCSCGKWFADQMADTEINDKSGVVVPKDAHSYIKLEKDVDNHWNECVCGDKQGITAHFGGTATCTEKAKCEVCGVEHGSVKAHEYKILNKDATNHWYECICGNKQGVTAHFGGTATCTEKAKCEVCDEGYGTLKSHEYKILNKDATDHWYECVCGDKQGVTAHFGGTATCTEKAICDGCGVEYGSMKEHQYNTLNKNVFKHWWTCV